MIYCSSQVLLWATSAEEKWPDRLRLMGSPGVLNRTLNNQDKKEDIDRWFIRLGLCRYV